MTITILSDNHAGSFTGAEHGLSYFIEHDGKKILFDTGQSDLFLINSGKLHINPADADHIVLSHGHFDHGNGLEHLNGGHLICHPDCFRKRYRLNDHTDIGLKLSRSQIKKRFKLQTSGEPFSLTEKIIFLGEIPRVTDFESITTTFVLADGSPDFISDDSALALVLPEGLFVVTGCGHSGIVNTVEYAIAVTGIDRVFGVTGGFHLKYNDEVTQKTIQYFEQKEVRHVLPSHCTAFPALAAFYSVFGNPQLKTGDILRF